MFRWEGVFPALTTKMKADGSLDLGATQDSIQRLVDAGVSGIIVLPMLGENTAMHPGEREAVIRGAREVVNDRIPVLSGLAEVTLEAAQFNARAYETYGAQGLMVFPSLGYKTDRQETVHWYRSIASASVLPIMIYNNPIAYGVDVDVEVLRELADVPEIACIKEETGDPRRVSDMYVEFGKRFSVFCGVDDLYVQSAALGVSGWVSGMCNVWPEVCVELFDLCRKGEFDAARKLNELMTPAFHLDTEVKLVQFIKIAEQIVYGAPDYCRPPRLPAAQVERKRVERIVQDTIRALSTRRDAALHEAVVA